MKRNTFTFGKVRLEGVTMMHLDNILFFDSKRFLVEVDGPVKINFQISREEKRAFQVFKGTTEAA